MDGEKERLVFLFWVSLARFISFDNCIASFSESYKDSWMLLAMSNTFCLISCFIFLFLHGILYTPYNLFMWVPLFDDNAITSENMSGVSQYSESVNFFFWRMEIIADWFFRNTSVCIRWWCSQGHWIDRTASTWFVREKYGFTLWSFKPSFHWTSFVKKKVSLLSSTHSEWFYVYMSTLD